MSSRQLPPKCIQHEPESCGICYETYNSQPVYLPCFHNICFDCFNKLNKSICPFCRFDFTSELSRSEQASNITYSQQYHLEQNQSISFNHIGNDSELDILSEINPMYLDRLERRQKQLQRRHRNKQRRLQNRLQYNLQNNLQNRLYDYHIIFNEQNDSSESSESSDSSSTSSVSSTSSDSTKHKINHRLDKKARSKYNSHSILSFR